jgi:hypothetical protein
MKSIAKAIVALVLVVAVALIAQPVAAVPLIEVPGAYLNPPASFLMNDPIVHDGPQVGYQLEISQYSAHKYIEGNETLEFMYLTLQDGTGVNYQIRLATKQALYPYTEYNPQNWYPGWQPAVVGGIQYTVSP